jgi:hypothetical protein
MKYAAGCTSPHACSTCIGNHRPRLELRDDQLGGFRSGFVRMSGQLVQFALHAPHQIKPP